MWNSTRTGLVHTYFIAFLITTVQRTCACSNIVVVCRFRERKLTHIQYHISICRCFAWIVNNGAVALILLAIPLEKAALFSFRSSRTSREGRLHAMMKADGTYGYECDAHHKVKETERRIPENIVHSTINDISAFNYSVLYNEAIPKMAVLQPSIKRVRTVDLSLPNRRF